MGKLSQRVYECKYPIVTHSFQEAIFSAALIPSRAELMIPPAYPEPSPQG
jgi:hypothetical protein